MPNKIFILMLLFSGMFAAWTFASPPSGTPGATLGALFSDSAGNVGIRTSVPATLLDVNGTTTIRESLDMTNNRILNVATPTSSADAANKAYVDTQIANISSSTTKIWSQGRPGTAVINAAGECTRAISGKTIKVSRSTRPTSWDGTAAACPIGWWVCSATDRGTTACGSGNRNGVFCNIPGTGSPGGVLDELYNQNNTLGWVSNILTTSLAGREFGMTVNTAGTASDDYTCSLRPVWCCAYQ